MNEIETLIGELERLRKSWEREVAMPESAMTRADVKFLDRQIRKLEKLRERVTSTVEEVTAEVKKHTEGW